MAQSVILIKSLLEFYQTTTTDDQATEHSQEL